MPLLPSARKGLGALLEGQKVVETRPFSTMHLPVAPNLLEFSLEEFIPVKDGAPVILDQGATNSCTAHAFIAGIHLAETRAGLPFVPCSRLFAYYHARREMDEGMILDNGAYLRTCAEGLAHFGVPDEKHWPFSEFTMSVNRRPNFDSMRWAHPRAGGKYVKIYSMGENRLDAVKMALHAGHPVAFGTLVSKSFLDMSGPAYVSKDNSPPVGGHAMLIIGWKTDASNITWFRVLNSWGRGWRDGGLCWMHSDLIGGQLSDDFHVIYGWKRIVDAKGAP